ncbi:MAG TPA: RHS repeat-associated core domain-containing protein [Pyrinomonadaceae bacterium]
MADSAGSINAQNGYDSFGNPTNSNFASQYQFTGREFDSYTGLHSCRARWYDSTTSRFISEDPIGFAGGDINLFTPSKTIQ